MMKFLIFITVLTILSSGEGAKAKVRFLHYPDNNTNEYPMFDADNEEQISEQDEKNKLSTLEKVIIDKIIYELLDRRIKDSMLNSWLKSVKNISHDHDLCIKGQFNVTIKDVYIKYRLEQLLDISGINETHIRNINKDLNVNSVLKRKKFKEYTVRNQKLDSPGPSIEIDLQNNTVYLNEMNLAITYIGMTAVIKSVKLTFSIKGKGTSRWYNYSPAPAKKKNSDKNKDSRPEKANSNPENRKI